MGILLHLKGVGTGDTLLPWMIPPSLTTFSDPIPHLFGAPLVRGSNLLWKGRKMRLAERDLSDEGMTSFPSSCGGGELVGRVQRVHPSGAKPGHCALASPQSHPPFFGRIYSRRHSKKVCLSLGGFPPPGAVVGRQ